MANRSRSLLVVWLAVRGFSCLKMGAEKKKIGQKAKQEKREVTLAGAAEKRNLVEGKPCFERLVNYFLYPEDT